MTLNRRQVLQAVAAGGLVLKTPLALAQLDTNIKNDSLTILTGNAFGATWQLTLPGADNPTDAIDIIVDIVRTIDRSMSPWRTDSELCVFNRLPVNNETAISDAFSTVVRASLQMAADSSGAFDPTVGPAVNRLGFGPVTGNAECTYADIKVENNTISKSKSGATVDFCGIAKGYALDEMTSALLQAGYQHFLLELGGELVAHGRPVTTGRQRQWTVGIDLPPTNSIPPYYRCVLDNRSIATSGMAHNSFTFNEHQYSHLVDPRRKRSTHSQLYSVSVMHDSAMLADAWSTALYVLGTDKGLALATAHKLDALFISNNMQFTGTGEFYHATGATS